jgi:cytochrome c-type protein NapC
VAGILFWGGFNTAMEWTNREEFCISCHEMRDNVYAEYRNTIHYQNRTGVRATCPDCHVPKEWTHKIIRKIQASNEVLAPPAGQHRHAREVQRQARRTGRPRVGAHEANDSRECRNCHNFDYMDYAEQNQARRSHAPGGVSTPGRPASTATRALRTRCRPIEQNIGAPKSSSDGLFHAHRSMPSGPTVAMATKGDSSM